MLYYKFTKYFSLGCKSRLIFCSKNNVTKGVNICSIDKITEINSQAYKIPPVEFSNNYILEKTLLLQNIWVCSGFIAVKSAIYHTFREQRSSIFFKFNSGCDSSVSKRSSKFRTLFHKILFTHEALSLMRYNSHKFIDYIFQSTPSLFIQFLIVMVPDAVSEHNFWIVLSKIKTATNFPDPRNPIETRDINRVTRVQPELISFWRYFDLTQKRRFELKLWNI
ncbi:hypothetical protein MXB_467 [Myxobolus squamalis]|nr:hypothetical protein MXB_467 [Myxobolus squamalis]